MLRDSADKEKSSKSRKMKMLLVLQVTSSTNGEVIGETILRRIELFGSEQSERQRQSLGHYSSITIMSTETLAGMVHVHSIIAPQGMRKNGGYSSEGSSA